MNQHKSHRFIATASTAAVSLTMLVAAGALAQETSPTDAVAAVATSSDASPSATATQLQARIIDVSGKARWRASPDAEWKDASVNDDLSPGAEVRTGMRSRVTLRFRNATVLVDSSTNFAIPTIEQEGDVLRTIAAVRSGRADFKVDKVGLQNDFKVVTPSTTLAVRGTSFSTITGPLKGVEIVGARENGIRAIELRYAALNQTVEMSGGSEAKSTSETPNPTEHALGNTFNAPQTGMIASKEEAQQGALSGSSAPQTQRQATTTVAAVTQVRQDLDAAARGESGNGNLAVLIDISRAAGFRSVAEDASALQADVLAEALAAAQLAHDRIGQLGTATDSYEDVRGEAEVALAAARQALLAAQSADSAAVSGPQTVIGLGNAAFRDFSSAQDESVVRSHVTSARELVELAASVQQRVTEAGGRLGELQSAADLLVPADSELRLAMDAVELAMQALNADVTDVNRLRDSVVSANAAVQALAANRNIPQVTEAAIRSAQAAADALQRVAVAGAARDAAALEAGIALARAQSVLREAMVEEIQSTAAAVAALQARIGEAAANAALAQGHFEVLDAAIDGMLLARSGADEATAAADAANAFRALAEGRQVAAQAQADFAVGIGELVGNDRLTALAEMQSALDALARCELNAAATSVFARQVSEALGQESPDVNAATTAAAQAMAQAVLAQHEAGEATAASERAEGAAITASGRVNGSEFTGSETLYGQLVQGASDDADDAEHAWDLAAGAAEASEEGASVAAGLSQQLASVFSSGGEFGSSDAGMALAAAQQLAEDAARRAADAQVAYLAAQAAYEGAVAAGRSSAEVTVWGAVRRLAEDAHRDATSALAAAAEARRVASIAMAEALAADAAVTGAGFPALAQLSRDAAASAKASALSGMGDVLALVQAHQQVLDESGTAVAQALATMGSSLAATEVAQNSASGVAQRLTAARDAIFSFMAIDEAGDPSDAQLEGLLDALLNARNEGLGLALAAGAGAADAGAAVAAHASDVASSDAQAALAQANAVQAILSEAAAALGTDENDARLALMRDLRDRALDRAAAAAVGADQAVALVPGATGAQAQARDALAALGLVPTWGVGDVASTYGSDVESAAGAAAEAARVAGDAAHGASVLIAVHGAAVSAEASIGASEQGMMGAAQAQYLAVDAAAAARSAAQQVAGGDSSARAEALAAIAQVRGEVTSLRAQSNSSMAHAGGTLDALLQQLSSGTLNASDAMSSLADAQGAASAARENADAATVAGAGAAAVSAQFELLVSSLGIGGAQARQVIEEIDQVHLAAALAARTLADEQRANVESFVASVLAAAAAGDSVAIDDLAFAAAWIREVTIEDFQALQESIALAQAARSDALDAVDELEAASVTAAAPVVGAAQDAVDAAEQFLQQVVALQIEVALGGRAVGGEIARAAAVSVESQVASRASQVALTVSAMREAVGEYAGATGSMSAAVAAAQAARDLAESRLMQLEDSLASADSRIASLRASLSMGDRSVAAADAGAIASSAAGAGALASEADAARADALSALAGIDALGAAATAAIVSLDAQLVEASGHQFALAWHQEQAEAVQGDAHAAADGVSELVAEAGTDRADALGAHALAASGEALSRASQALAGVLSAGGSLQEAVAEANGLDRNLSGTASSQASALREWVYSLDYGSSSIPEEIAGRVVAMSGVAQGVMGAYDSRVAAIAARQGTELARDQAVAAEYVSFSSLESHNSALVGVNQEFETASGQLDVAQDEFMEAAYYRLAAGFWLQQTLGFVRVQDAGQAAWAAGVSDERATSSENAAGRADAAATLAEEAGDRALDWAGISATAFAVADAAALEAEANRDLAASLAVDVTAAGSAATSFADAAQQFASIAATAAADDASTFARQARDQAVAQIVLAEAARDAAQAAAASARNHASKIVFGAVAAKASQTVALATQARDYADAAMTQAMAARTDANAAIVAASSAAGGTN